MNNKKIIIILGVVVLAIVVAIFTIMTLNKPETVSGAKEVTFQVIFEDQSEKEFVINTDAEFLGDALLAEGIVEGEDQGAGFYVDTIDGVTADMSASQWWCFCDGEGNMLMVGIAEQPIQDGENYQAIFSTF